MGHDPWSELRDRAEHELRAIESELRKRRLGEPVRLESPCEPVSDPLALRVHLPVRR